MGLKGSEGNVIGAVGVIGPSIRLVPDKIRECIAPLKVSALEISRDLGYRGR